MKGDPKVIELLNEALKAELTAINQYWLHYRLLDNWGVKKLAEFERQESIDEMKHADRFAERILFLDGLPNFQALGRLRIGENVEEILKADLEAEHGAVQMYRDGAAYCESVHDFVSRDLFTEVRVRRRQDAHGLAIRGTRHLQPVAGLDLVFEHRPGFEASRDDLATQILRDRAVQSQTLVGKRSGHTRMLSSYQPRA